MKKIKSFLLLLGALFILGIIIYAGSYSLKLHQGIQNFINKFQQTPVTSTSELPEIFSNLQQDSKNWNLMEDNLSPFIKDLNSLLSVIPEIREDVKLQENFVEARENIKMIVDGALLHNLFEGKENALSYLKDLNDNLGVLERLNLEIISRGREKVMGWLEFLGEKEPKHYLVLLQTPEIPRPTGGFLGAYILIGFNQGKLDFQGGHINILDDKFNKMLVPPFALKHISNRWFFHDLNWFYDISFSGRKILDNYNNHIKTPLLDGVIFINPNVIQNLLEILGPLNLDQYHLTIEANNFKEFLINQVTEGLKPLPERKQVEVLADFFQALYLQLKNAPREKLTEIWSVITEGYSAQDIQIYFASPTLAHKILDTNETEPFEKNTLIVTWNSLSHELKSHSSIKKLKIQEKILEDGKVEVNLEIREDPGYQERYLKIYLPYGVKLTSAYNCRFYSIEENPDFYRNLGYQEDTEVLLQEHQLIKDDKNKVVLFPEGNFTVVGCWVDSPFKFVKISYLLPFSLDKDYWSLNIKKQSGQEIYVYYQLLLPSNKKLQPTILPLNEWLPLDRDIELKFELEENESNL